MQIVLNDILSLIHKAVSKAFKFMTVFQSRVRLREVYGHPSFWVITGNIADLRHFKSITWHKQMGHIYVALPDFILFAAYVLGLSHCNKVFVP